MNIPTQKKKKILIQQCCLRALFDRKNIEIFYFIVVLCFDVEFILFD